MAGNLQRPPAVLRGMRPLLPVALAAAFFACACASAKVPASAARAAEFPPPEAMIPEEPPAPKPEPHCLGSAPQPEKKTHRDWPPPPRATCCYPDKEGIRRVIQAKYPAMQQCYDTSLTRSSPPLKSRVTVKFTVQPDGSVPLACDSGSDVQDREMLDCVLRAFLDLRFPAQSGDLCPPTMSIVYPIIFRPE